MAAFSWVDSASTPYQNSFPYILHISCEKSSFTKMLNGDLFLVLVVGEPNFMLFNKIYYRAWQILGTSSPVQLENWSWLALKDWSTHYPPPPFLSSLWAVMHCSFPSCSLAESGGLIWRCSFPSCSLAALGGGGVNVLRTVEDDSPWAAYECLLLRVKDAVSSSISCTTYLAGGMDCRPSWG